MGSFRTELRAANAWRGRPSRTAPRTLHRGPRGPVCCQALRRYCCLRGAQLAKRGQATLDGLERRVRASFLLDQVILDAPGLLGGLKDFLPGRDPFAEQDP